MNTSIKKWLFRPAEYIGAQKALWIGIAAMLISGFINIFTHSHFDGVIDFHTGNVSDYSFQAYLYEGFVDWLVFSLLLYITGLIFSSSSIRIIDVMGMQALARCPFFLVSLLTLLLPHREVDEYLKSDMLKAATGTPIIVPIYEWIFFGLSILLIIAIFVWTVILMYRAYSVSCNLKGEKGIISFIVVMLIAEGIIKYLFHLTGNYFLVKQ